MAKIMVERRKMEYLSEYSCLSLKSVDKHFEDIDKRMARVCIGTKMVDVVSSSYDDFPVVVIEIINKEKGLVSIYEESVNSNRIMSILNLEFIDDYTPSEY